MFKCKSPIKLREIIIAGLIGLTIFILGLIFDQKFTQSVYSATETNAFGIFFSGIAELPICFALTFGGISLIVYRPKTMKKVWEVLSIIVGVIAILASTYFTYDTWCDFYSFNNTESLKTLFVITGIIFTLLFQVITIIYVIFFTKHNNPRTMLLIGLVFIGLALSIAIAGTAMKYLWSRPRPRFIYDPDNYHPELFRNAWQLNPFEAFKVEVSNNYKSFPSGHSIYSASAMFVLPLLTLTNDEMKNDRRLQVILFYVGLLWALLSAFSRVYAGAHFLSDVGAGFLVTYIIGSLGIYFIFKDKKAETN